MKTNFIIPGSQLDLVINYSDAEKIERRALGLPACEPALSGLIKKLPKDRKLVSKKIITEPKVLNEVSEYGMLASAQTARPFTPAISAPNPGTRFTISPVCSRAKTPLGATLANSTPSATNFSTRWDWTRSRPAPAFRRGFAEAICSWKSKPSP